LNNGCMISAGMIDKIKQALASRKKMYIMDSSLTDAAVLLPVFKKDGKCHIIFTKRTDHLTHHKGQISFPGGSRHQDDASLLETALRESREEIGLKESDVEILGELDDTATTTSHFRISPFVGLVPYPYDFKIDKYEVQEIFDLPIEELLEKASEKEEYTISGERIIKVYTFEINGRVIWGATAWILNQFLEIIRSVSGARYKN
jgi:8-oxo-dGTP pyrophosphatase MutT (NUDIX family)